MTSDSAVFNLLVEGATLGPSHHRFSLLSASGSTVTGPLWLAEDLAVQGLATVALNFIDPALYTDDALMESLKRQVALGKKLKHKHILAIHGLFNHQNSLRFISSDPIEGRTLAHFIADGKAGKLNKEQLQGLLLQLAAALDTAYGTHHTVHGALCPAFIYLGRNGVKLTGFGLNDFMDRLPDTLRDERSYLPYMAPEAHHSLARTRACDIYALACISYELLTGKPPFESTLTPEQCNPKTLKRPTALSPQGWELVQSALSQDMQQRPGSAVRFIRAIFNDEDANEEPTAAPQQTPNTIEPESTEPPPQSSLKALDRLKLSALRYPITFISGVLLGYLLSYLLMPAPETTLASTPDTPKQATSHKISVPSDTVIPPDHQQTAGKTVTTPTTTPETTASVMSTLDAVTASDQPRTVMFRDHVVDNIYGPDMVVIPAGSFLMGARSKQADDNEYPQHTVIFADNFALGRYEVSFAQYDLFAEETGRPLPADEGWGRGDRPVINVSWKDANAYVTWLASVTGQPYRLPSEAEWEYAARAGSEAVFAWGDAPPTAYAVCDSCGSEWDGRQSAPIGSLKANAWGLFDMAGNVGEWVADCYQPDYNQAPNDGRAVLATPCASRVVRGGSWFDIPRLIRPAGRYRHPPNAKQNDWGFRVALDLPNNKQDTTR